MKRKLLRRIAVVLLVLAVCLSGATLSLAQEDAPALELRLSRDFGMGIGSNIQGTFSYRVSAPDDVVRVVFLLDGEPVGEVTEAPFRFQFQTDDFPEGPHTLSAVGYTAAGEALRSNSVTRNFLAGEASQQARNWIIGGVVVIIVLSLGVSFAASMLSSRSGKVAVSGAFGTAVCPNCGKPFARHAWGLNLVVGKLDRCPHCGKWNLVQRASPAQVEAAMELLGDNAGETAVPTPLTQEETLRKRLEDSRYTD